MTAEVRFAWHHCQIAAFLLGCAEEPPDLVVGYRTVSVTLVGGGLKQQRVLRRALGTGRRR